MSVEAAKAFDISQEDLLKFLGQKEEPESTTPTITSKSGNQEGSCLQIELGSSETVVKRSLFSPIHSLND